MTCANPAPVGQRRWAISEGYIPPGGTTDDTRFFSHETACLLNSNDQSANVTLAVYFKGREPVGPCHVTVPARRTPHLRFNDLADPSGADRYRLFQRDRVRSADRAPAHPAGLAPVDAGVAVDDGVSARPTMARHRSASNCAHPAHDNRSATCPRRK